jgi:hypothetical protein
VIHEAIRIPGEQRGQVDDLQRNGVGPLLEEVLADFRAIHFYAAFILEVEAPQTYRQVDIYFSGCIMYQIHLGDP